jgi:hypothetical protein
VTDTLDEPDEPAWMVIAPLTLEQIEPVVNAVLTGEGWQLVEGTRDHIAIVGEPELQGLEDRLAEDLSKLTDGPVYALVFDEEDPRVDAFIGGEEAGVVAANLYDVAHVLGVGIDERDPNEPVAVDLRAHRLPEARPGDLEILGKTLPQWQHLMMYELNWDLVLEDAPGDEVLPLLDHEDPAVRAVAVKLVGGLGPGAFAGVDDVIAKLHEMADANPELRADIDEAIELLDDDDA